MFGVFNRRYECSNCGTNVCLDHSTHKISRVHQKEGMTMNHYRTCHPCTKHLGNESDDDVNASPSFKPTPPPKPARPASLSAHSSSDSFGGAKPRPLFRSPSMILANASVPPSPSASLNNLVQEANNAPLPMFPSVASAGSMHSGRETPPVEAPVTPISTYSRVTPGTSPSTTAADNTTPYMGDSNFQDKLDAMKKKCSVAKNRPLDISVPQPVLHNIVLGYIATIKEPRLGKEEQEQKDEYEAKQQQRRASFGVYKLYDKMREMNVPIVAVRQRMMGDGFSAAEVNAYMLAVERAQEGASGSTKSDRDTIFNSESQSWNGSAVESPPADGSATDVGGAPHVRVASMLFREKIDAMNKRGGTTLSRPNSVPVMPVDQSSTWSGKGSQSAKLYEEGVKKTQTSTTRPLSTSSAPRHSTSEPLLSALNSTDSSASNCSSPGQYNTRTIPEKVVSTTRERPLSCSVGERVSQFNIPSPSAGVRGSPMNQTYPYRSKEAVFDDIDLATQTPTPKRSSSPFIRADPKVASNTTLPKAVNEVKSSKTSRKSSCEIVDSATLLSRPPASTLTTLSEVKKNIEGDSMESFSSRTTVESKTSTSTVTYTYEYDVDTDEDNEPKPTRSRKSKSKASRPKSSHIFSEKEVRAKMEEDGVSQEDIADFLTHLTAAMQPQKAKDSQKSKENSDSFSGADLGSASSPGQSGKSFPVSTRVMEVPEGEGISSIPSNSKYSTYDRMRAMRVPDGGVRQKMSSDGFSAYEINAYFNGDTAVAGSGSTKQQTAIPPPPPPPPPPPAPVSAPVSSVPVKGGQSAAAKDQSKDSTSKRESSQKSVKASSTDVVQNSKGKDASEKIIDVKIAPQAQPLVKPVGVEVEKKKENPVSRLFASIRSGVTLKKQDSEKSVENLPRVASTTKSNSLHGLLSIALESRRKKSNIEVSENCPSEGSAVDFDLD